VQAGRYHLYVANACPWAHRTAIFRQLKGLQGVISMSGVEPLMLDNGWTFSSEHPDPVGGHDLLHQVYTRAAPDYTGRVTVPLLWDKQRGTAVNNESSEIIRMLNGPMAALSSGVEPHDHYPAGLREEIDAVNARVYETLNNGVYRCGFSTDQQVYARSVEALFATLDWLERRLQGNRWLVGGVETEADWRLFTTLVRFDSIYHGHFKCNIRRLVDYPNLWRYTRVLYNMPGIAETIDLEDAKLHYYGSHPTVNPSGVVPSGPALCWQVDTTG
jgi:putative glutathione S-transferase